MSNYIEINRLDTVKLLTTKRVSYVSTFPGNKVDPNGNWTVAAIINNDLLCTKDNITIRIPSSDVLKIASFKLDDWSQILGKLSHGKK